ncbi:MAG: pteridine-dependent deoxygenase, partial [Steroidobacteraceae bacterium]
VGHASQHPGSLIGQLEETLANLGAVRERAATMQPALPRSWGAGTLLKVYLRDGAAATCAAAHLAARMPPGVRCLTLEADICRPDLLVEIDCVHGL